MVEIRTRDSSRKYYKALELPSDADINAAKSSYNNGILEVTFAKNVETKSKGNEIKIE